MKKSLLWLFSILLFSYHSDLKAQCSFSDCTGNPVFNINAPTLSNGEIIFDNIEIGNFSCSGSASNTSGLSIFIFELLPDGSRVSSCGTFLPVPDNYLGHIPLAFGSGTGCATSFTLFTPASPFTIGSAQGFQSCDGAVYEVEVYLFLDPNGIMDGSINPYSDIQSLDSDQKELVSFGPIHNTISGNFPSTGFGGPLVVNEIGSWSSIQLGGAPGQDFSIGCDEDIELYVRATSVLTQCDPTDVSSGLPSELSNILNYSVNGGPSVDIIAAANLPAAGGVQTGLDPQIGNCYSGIYTSTNPTIISAADINPMDGDIVSITVSTSDVFTGQTESSTINVTYTGMGCGPLMYGCTDSNACNYDASADSDDGTCIYPGDGCDDGDANTEDDMYDLNCICVGTAIPEVEGCTDNTACNYDPSADTDDGSCIAPDCEGNCMGSMSGPAQPGTACDDGDPNTENDMYNAVCVCEGTLIPDVDGCTDALACNYDPVANVDDGSCIAPDCEGNCMGSMSGPAQPGTACDDGESATENDVWTSICVCEGDLINYGCTDPTACNFDAAATVDDGSCISVDCEGNCDGLDTGPAQPGTDCDDGDNYTVGDVWTVDCFCVGMSPYGGCTDATACNFNPDAVVDDGSCIPADCEGNCDGYYSGPATPGSPCDDGDPTTENDVYQIDCSCIGNDVIVPGCTDPSACNYLAEANYDDGSCLELDCLGECGGPDVAGTACDDGDSNTINDLWTLDCTCAGDAVILGCTDVNACNYNADANSDDGSCLIVGDICDDGDPLTDYDSINDNCDCEGISSSVEDIELGISISPNPVEDILLIHCKNQNGILEYRIVDLNGKTVMSQYINESLQQIDLSYLDSGYYLIQFILESDYYTAKLIKN